MSTSEKPTTSVFVSFAEADKQIAHDFVMKPLEEAGLQPFVAPVHIPAGAAWQNELLKELRNASALIALCSEQSLRRDWVLEEYGAAWALGIPIFPLTLRLSNKKLPGLLRSYEALPFGGPEERKQAIREIVKNVTARYSWDNVRAAIRSIHETLRKRINPPDYIVGSGKGGAICGAMLADIFGCRFKACNIRKWDCNGEERRDVDLSALTDNALAGKHVLVFEYFHDTGSTYNIISEHILKQGACSVIPATLLCAQKERKRVKYHSRLVTELICPPWQDDNHKSQGEVNKRANDRRSY
jgi:hypoxanthine phosphoribosyltransferase